MGSKTEIIEFIAHGLNTIHKPEQPVCDLFAGSCTLASALRENDIQIYSNDIQAYSAVLARTYLGNYTWNNYPSINTILSKVEQIVSDWKRQYPKLWSNFNYDREFTLDEFVEVEQAQSNLLHNDEFIRSLVNSDNEHIRNYHLFTLDYSGTYWGFQQCVWIDSLRCVIDEYKESPEFYNALLSCTMFAMAYNSQSTGHYAQFRKAQTQSSMDDILIYRRKTMESFFRRKFEELSTTLFRGPQNCVTQLDFSACINELPEHTLVYADPPYCFVHYSRFYHILETFVLYDYPVVQFDGRYRNDRHQSPFCIATKVEPAFSLMFERLKARNCELVLSYSNSDTTMIKLPQLLISAYSIFNNVSKEKCQSFYTQLEKLIQELVLRNVEEGKNSLNISAFFEKHLSRPVNYHIALQLFPHVHSRMGRTKKKDIDVFEALILVYHL